MSNPLRVCPLCDQALLPVRRMERVARTVAEASIDILAMSSRPTTCLRKAGIHTVMELTALSEGQVAKIKYLGRTSLEEIRDALARFGLVLRPESLPERRKRERREAAGQILKRT